MGLNNQYHIKKKSIKQVLDNVDSFITNMENFTARHIDYTYNIEIYKVNDLWNADITIKNEKK